MASTEIRDRRRTPRYRSLRVRRMVQTKNRISGLVMGTGVTYNKRRLHKVGYFRERLASNEEVNENIRPLLRLSRDTIARLRKMERALVSSLQRDPVLAEGIRQLRTVPGVGHYCTDLGPRDGRDFALRIDPPSDQLLRALRRRKKLSREVDSHTDFQTAQQKYPICADRGCEVSAPTGSRSCIAL